MTGVTRVWGAGQWAMLLREMALEWQSSGPLAPRNPPNFSFLQRSIDSPCTYWRRAAGRG